MDVGKQVCALFMDLTKAFDYVDHKILLDKLYAYGVRGNIYDLIKSYLSDRTQITQVTRICPLVKKVLNHSSACRKVTSGVPQGSVLGPLLFIIYINDLPKASKYSTILFADDSTVLFTGDDKLHMEPEINMTLENIVNWLTSNKLHINFSKTNLMTFRNKINKISGINTIYNNYKIKEVEATRFLGINIDNTLTFKEHIHSLCTKINTYSYALYMLRKTVSSSTVLTAYHGYVLPLLKYCVIFWGNSTEKEVIFKAQKKCIRAITNIKQTDSCRQLFLKLNILTLPCIYILETVLFVKKNMHYFKKLNSKRHKFNIGLPYNKTALLNKSIFCMAPRIYNNLPNSILEISDVNIFKQKIKKLLIKKVYYSVNEYLQDTLM